MTFKELTAQNGVRNDLSPERFKSGDLVTGVNIEIDETGKVYTRLGTSAAIYGGVMHSLWADGTDAFAVRNGSLGRIDMTSLAHSPLIPVTGRVSYQRVVESVFFSDGVYSGELTAAGVRRAGITPPPLPAATATLGDMRAGTYLFTATYVRSDGTESGAPRYGSITLGSNQGVEFALTNSSDPDVIATRLYLSHWNGELPYAVGEYPPNTLVATVTQLPTTMSLPCRTQLMLPVPAGQLLGYYNGRLYVAENNYLWYSQPHEYGLFNPLKNYIGFTSPIRTFAAVSDGIYIGSDDETVFLAGDDPAEFVRKQVAKYGTVSGTEKSVPEYYVGDKGVVGVCQMWMSTHGQCVGLNGGEFRNLTGGRYILPVGVSQGASLLKVRGGTPQMVVSLS